MNHQFRAWALSAVVFLTPLALAGSEPRSGAGAWERVESNHWLLRDPFTAHPAALLDDPLGWLSPGGHGVIDGLWDSSGAGLGVMTVQDVSPEFWAQPSVWEMFQRGPSVYSGFNKDAGPREWAGRPALDRRAYDLDPGWEWGDVFTPSPTPGVGPIKLQVGAGGVTLHWHALPGRVYTIEFTPALGRTFQVLQTLGSFTEGDASLVLSTGSANGFYRIAEQVY